MCGARHTIHYRDHHHCQWDRSIAPALMIAPGDTVSLSVQDASDGQITPSSTACVLDDYDGGRVNPVTGPIFVDGAEPGDAIAVTLIDYRPSGWGWTAIIPGFGLLADDFAEAELIHWTYDPACAQPALFADIAKVPLAPFAGTIGVAPSQTGPHSIIPPRRTGGNIDLKDTVRGATVLLPVEASGALLSIGDTHAAQGDGEVCGTAIESAMELTVSVELIKQRSLRAPIVERPNVQRRPDNGGILVTTGIGPDLMTCARDAVSAMVDELGRRRQMRAEDAYMLQSVAGDLVIGQVVDAPNWTVAMRLPLGVFGE